MAAKRGGYESAAEMQVTGHQEWVQRPGTVTRAEYDAISEYACALEAENASLKSGRSNEVTIVSTLEAASAATKTTTGLLAEMRAVHAAQMREITALVAAATAGNAPAPPRKERQSRYQTQIHVKPARTRRVRYPPP